MDSLRGEFTAVERRWKKVKTESEEWGRVLELLHPEMETFQVYYDKSFDVVTSKF